MSDNEKKPVTAKETTDSPRDKQEGVEEAFPTSVNGQITD
jgi:hypothetical protein